MYYKKGNMAIKAQNMSANPNVPHDLIVTHYRLNWGHHVFKELSEKHIREYLSYRTLQSDFKMNREIYNIRVKRAITKNPNLSANFYIEYASLIDWGWSWLIILARFPEICKTFQHNGTEITTCREEISSVKSFPTANVLKLRKKMQMPPKQHTSIIHSVKYLIRMN